MDGVASSGAARLAEAGRWTVDLKVPGGAVYEGEPKNGAKPGESLVPEKLKFESND